jgi:hypothetical protein
MSLLRIIVLLAFIMHIWNHQVMVIIMCVQHIALITLILHVRDA